MFKIGDFVELNPSAGCTALKWVETFKNKSFKITNGILNDYKAQAIIPENYGCYTKGDPVTISPEYYRKVTWIFKLPDSIFKI